MVTHSQNNIHQPRIPIDGTITYPLPHALNTSLTTHDTEPTCFTFTSKHQEWYTTMVKEFNALIKKWDMGFSSLQLLCECCWSKMGLSSQEKG
jgi:hypothetical protein